MARRAAEDPEVVAERLRCALRTFPGIRDELGHEFDNYLENSGGIKELSKALISRGIKAILENPEAGYYPAKALEAMQRVLKEYVLLLDRENDLGMEKAKDRLGEIEKKATGLKEENERLRAENATLRASFAAMSVRAVENV